MNKVISCLLLLAAIANDVSAQDEFDALRYSNTQYHGTARGMGIGCAVGSMGADFSSLSINPAGIGIYKSSEAMITPSFSAANTNSSYLNSTNSATASKFNLSNFGLVITKQQEKKRYRKNAWRTVSFGVGMNRLATFKNESVYSGKNNKNSLIESFADDFNSLGGINTNALNSVNFSAYGAYQTYLIDRGTGADSNMAVSYVPYSDGLNQSKRVNESGGMSEYTISLGGNYLDKLMLGATLGLVSLSYDRTTRFDEEDASGNLSNNFKYMNYTERLSTSGTGINLKVGAIYKANSHFRVGLALHTPTHIELNDASSISITSHTDSLFLHNDPSANPVTSYDQDSSLVFNYSMNTPAKAIFSAMVLFGKAGFLTADIEYQDYASMKYKFTGYGPAENAINQVIRNTYKDAVNIRLGAEARLQNVALRGGFAYYGSPYSGNQPNGSRTTLSGGIGYREQAWFIDAAYVHSLLKTQEVPYILARSGANVPTANIDYNRGSVLLTLGLKF